MHVSQGDFFQHATERNQVWRIFMGLFIITVTYFAVIFATTIVLAWKGVDLYQVMMSGSPGGLALMLLSFFPVWRLLVGFCTNGAYRLFMALATN